MNGSPQHEITHLLRAWSGGQPGAAGRLMPLVNEELHRLARSFGVRGRLDHTLQTTALVHEAYLRWWTSLYHLALEQEQGSRSAFVAKECGVDEALQEVESLLAASEGAHTCLETPAVQIAARARAQDEAGWSMAGKTVSHYRVVEHLGGGGAEVYRAECTRGLILERLGITCSYFRFASGGGL